MSGWMDHVQVLGVAQGQLSTSRRSRTQGRPDGYKYCGEERLRVARDTKKIRRSYAGHARSVAGIEEDPGWRVRVVTLEGEHTAL